MLQEKRKSRGKPCILIISLLLRELVRNKRAGWVKILVVMSEDNDIDATWYMFCAVSEVCEPGSIVVWFHCWRFHSFSVAIGVLYSLCFGKNRGKRKKFKVSTMSRVVPSRLIGTGELSLKFYLVLIMHTLLIMHLAAYSHHLHVLYTDTPLQTMQLATPKTPWDPPDSGFMYLICEQ